MQTLWQDLRYGARMLLKNPGFTLIAVCTLALGIGANTAIFSIINTVLLKPLPFPHAERIVAVGAAAETSPQTSIDTISYPDFQDLREQSSAFERMAVYDTRGFIVTGENGATRWRGAIASAGLFSVLGVKPLYGRAFLPGEDKAGGGRVVVLSQSLWQKRFNGDQNVIGKAVTINGESFTAVGVMPAGFQFPIQAEPVELWANYAKDCEDNGADSSSTQRGNQYLRAIGLLKPETNLVRADAQLAAISTQLEKQYPNEHRDGRLDLVTQHLQRRVVTVQLGDGTGRFAMAPGSPITLAYSPGDIKLGDVNHDGLLDLGVTSSERDTVDIFLGNGSGKFTLAPGSPSVVSASAEFNTHGLQLVDLNEDGKLDIITTSNQQNSFATMFGNGRGGFSPGPAATFPAGQGRYAFAFGDLDGDGHLDAVIASGENGFMAEPGRVVMLRDDGKGAFKNFSETPVPTGPRYVTLGDANGDERPDLVFSHGSNQLSVLLNQGGGKFAPAPALSYDLGTAAFAVAVADVNQDKRNDLVVATVGSVTVLLNGKSGFAPAPGSPFRAGPGAYHFATGDINRDGKLDVAASSFEGKAVTVLLGRCSLSANEG